MSREEQIPLMSEGQKSAPEEVDENRGIFDIFRSEVVPNIHTCLLFTAPVHMQLVLVALIRLSPLP